MVFKLSDYEEYFTVETLNYENYKSSSRVVKIG